VPDKLPAKVQPPIVKEVPAPATRVSGAPTVRTPTAAVRKPVTVLMAVTATGADWVDTWKLAGFTVSVPAVATLNVHVLVQDAPPHSPIWKVVAVGVPHTTTFVAEASCAAVAMTPHPLIVREAVPATKVKGVPTARVPTAAVK
jgi:hypothetical protein